MIKERSRRLLGLSLIVPTLLVACSGSGSDGGGSSLDVNNSSSDASQSNETISIDGSGVTISKVPPPSSGGSGSYQLSSGSSTCCAGSSGIPFDELLANSTAPDAFGVVLDSAVSGLRYKSGDHYGVTDSDGKFGYIEGETVEFFIGDISLGGQIEPRARITPYEMAYGDAQIALNIARFLQTLDNDADPDNGIRINDAVHALAADITVYFTTFDWNTVTAQIGSMASSPPSTLARTSTYWSLS